MKRFTRSDRMSWKLWTSLSRLDWGQTGLRGGTLGLHRSGLVLVLMSSVETLSTYPYLLILNSSPALPPARRSVRELTVWLVAFSLLAARQLLAIHLLSIGAAANWALADSMLRCRVYQLTLHQTGYDWYYSVWSQGDFTEQIRSHGAYWRVEQHHLKTLHMNILPTLNFYYEIFKYLLSVDFKRPEETQ